MNKYYIYQHIRPDTNQVFYIGVGKEGTGRINNKRRNSIWTNIVKKIGTYKKEFLFRNLDLAEADQIESYLIRFYGKINNKTGILANILDGGHDNKDYHKMTAEEKKELSLKMKNNKYAKGVKWSEERRLKHSLKRKGKAVIKKGTKFSEETRQKMSKSHLGNLSNTGKIYINNGIISILIYKHLQIPEGFKLGRIITWKITGRPKKFN